MPHHHQYAKKYAKKLWLEKMLTEHYKTWCCVNIKYTIYHKHIPYTINIYHKHIPYTINTTSFCTFLSVYIKKAAFYYDTMYLKTTCYIINRWVLNIGVAPWRWRSATKIAMCGLYRMCVICMWKLLVLKMNYISMHNIKSIKTEWKIFSHSLHINMCKEHNWFQLLPQ